MFSDTKILEKSRITNIKIKENVDLQCLFRSINKKKNIIFNISLKKT